MNLLIHDLGAERFRVLFGKPKKNIRVISEVGEIKPCIGCFGCWVKTPGQCVIKDGYEHMGAFLAEAEQVTVISRCMYGGYSPFIKNVLDRSISYLLPFFKTANGRTHHKARYNTHFRLRVLFYGEDLHNEEKEIARELVKANSSNFLVSAHEVSFFESPTQLASEGGLQ